MNPLAKELNIIIQQAAPHVFEMLSELGKELYFPKGILTQAAEAKQKAHRHNATIGIAQENGEAMHLDAVMRQFTGHSADGVLPYAPSGGRPELRAKWRDELYRKNPSLAGKNVSLPLVTSGITHGLSLVADMFVDRGDAFLVPDKYWGNCNMIFGVRRGAQVVQHRFLSDSGGFDVESFREALECHAGRGKLVVMLNFPNNPTGYAVTEPEAEAICAALTAVAEDGCNLVVVCDDAYFGLFHDDVVMKESVFARLGGRHKRILTVKLDGATKEDFVWGLRVGFLTFATAADRGEYEALEKKAAGAIRGTISNCSNLSQAVVLRAMSEPGYEAEKAGKRKVLKARAGRVRQVLADSRFGAVWTPYPFNSGYFMCVKLKGIDAEQFRLRLLGEYGVGVIATGPQDIRVAFSCVDERDIPEVFDLMYKCAVAMTTAQAKER